jgi:hypothetical protein
MFDTLKRLWSRWIEKPKAPPPPKRPLTGTDPSDPESGEREISIGEELKRREKSRRG